MLRKKIRTSPFATCSGTSTPVVISRPVPTSSTSAFIHGVLSVTRSGMYRPERVRSRDSRTLTSRRSPRSSYRIVALLHFDDMPRLCEAVGVDARGRGAEVVIDEHATTDTLNRQAEPPHHLGKLTVADPISNSLGAIAHRATDTVVHYCGLGRSSAWHDVDGLWHITLVA